MLAVWGIPAWSAEGEPRVPRDQLPQIRNFVLVGSHPLTNPPGSRAAGAGLPRGMNGGLTVAGSCAYVGSRSGLQDVLIVDIADPARPAIVGTVPGIYLSAPREVRAVDDLHLLVVLHARLDAGVPTGENPTTINGTVSVLRVYNVAVCRRPILRAELDFGGSIPHQLFLWRDPHHPARVLAYVTFIAGDLPDLRVYDLTDALRGVRPRLLASFTLTPAVPEVERVNLNDPQQRFADDHFPFRATDLSGRVNERFLFLRRFGPQPLTAQFNRIHAVSVRSDGSRIYVAALHAGFFVLDSSNLADETQARACVVETVTADARSNDNPRLCLRKLNPDPHARVDWHPPEAGLTQLAVPLPGRPYVLVGDQRNGTTTCPWGWYRIVDVARETTPVVVAGSEILLPENRPQACRLGGPGDPGWLRDFSAAGATVFARLGLLTWNSGGLRAWDYADPQAPREVGVFVPQPLEQVQFPFRDSSDVWIWGTPVVRDGLIYVVDIRNGLYVLQYRGPRSSEIPRRGVHAGDMAAP
jgi:hypothetical protein